MNKNEIRVLLSTSNPGKVISLYNEVWGDIYDKAYYEMWELEEVLRGIDDLDSCLADGFDKSQPYFTTAHDGMLISVDALTDSDLDSFAEDITNGRYISIESVVEKLEKSQMEVTFDADDCNDEGWDVIIQVLEKNLKDFSVSYGDGDYMTFSWKK